MALAPGEGRKVIRMGIGHSNNTGRERIDVREAILEVLKDFGEMSTGGVYDELIMQGYAVGYEAMYGVLKKMAKRGLITKAAQKAKHGGKGVVLWKIADT